MNQCAVCPQSGKYNCPQCPLKYCSISCFKQHKDALHTTPLSIKCSDDRQSEAHSPLRTPQLTIPKIPSMFANNPRVKQIFIDQHAATCSSSLLTADQIVRLLSSESLQHNCQDPDLQRIIVTIANAPQEQLKILLLRHQLEFNHDFLRFIEALISNILNTNNTSVDQQQLDAIENLQELFDI